MSDVTAPARRRRWLAIGLVISLALNAFFVGALATDWLRLSGHFGGKDRGRDALRFELRWLAGRLPPDSLATISRALDEARPQTRPHFDRLRALQAELAASLAEPQPDRAAIDAKLAQIRSELDAMQSGVQKVTMDALLALPADKRADLAKARGPDKR